MREPDRSRPYMVMEWVKGCLLRDILDEQGKLPADRAIRIALSLCDALEHIHRCCSKHDEKRVPLTVRPEAIVLLSPSQNNQRLKTRNSNQTVVWRANIPSFIRHCQTRPDSWRVGGLVKQLR